MTTVEILRAARALIEKPEDWTQHEYSRDAKGEGVWPGSDEATCFCALGAVARVIGGDLTESSPAHVALRASLDPEDSAVCAKSGRNPVPYVNDERGHAAVLALYDRAIAACEAS